MKHCEKTIDVKMTSLTCAGVPKMILFENIPFDNYLKQTCQNYITYRTKNAVCKNVSLSIVKVAVAKL